MSNRKVQRRIDEITEDEELSLWGYLKNKSNESRSSERNDFTRKILYTFEALHERRKTIYCKTLIYTILKDNQYIRLKCYYGQINIT